ncbi:DNA replication protein [Bacillus toyonensis]|uniref:DNA replication protein n=1 Tax=Bacillus toyonensis TaxID=155322 RepID=A0AB36SVJ9_9BACI|nr:DnaD domain protein [Bacillus toyonensis]PKR94345.1 Deoxyuridine 5'-triphosphate nucleotidohydrolase, DUTP [Bacillus cereus Rock4-18]PEC10525.1 DNA replication protein [Bacillus toyonensis]PEJ61886.1 DNA replication protein [Bacillus toyonensis]PEM93899.1 DNA replication protein [Bacillus toyonensis]PEN71524.1 DNA replication protein [Bacillus toyonensis]
MTLIDRRRRGFFMIDNEIVDDARLSHKEMPVYMVLCRHLNQETGSYFPSLPTIGKKVGMSKNTVIKVLNALIEMGYVTKEKRSSKEKDGMSNVYYVNDVHDLNGGVHEVNPNNTNLKNTNLTISSSKKNRFTFYESNIGVLNPFMVDGIDQWIKDTSEELVIAVMERALKQQNKWNYAEGILKQWANKNIKTLDDVEALEDEYQRNKRAKNNAESGTSNTNQYSQKGEYDYGF